MTVRDYFDDIYFLEVRFEGSDVGKSPDFIVRPISSPLTRDSLDNLRPFLISSGSTASTISFIAIDTDKLIMLPRFYITSIRPEAPLNDQNTSEYSALTLDKPLLVPSKGFPLLHRSPCVDFDDIRGVMLIGNSYGELSLVEFEGGGICRGEDIRDNTPFMDRILSSSLNKLIPVCLIKGIYRLLTLLQTTPVHMDLPLVYEWHFTSPSQQNFWGEEKESNIPLEVSNEITAHWHEDLRGWAPPPGWSNDWRKFELLDQWLIPYLLWGESDPTSDRSPITLQLRTMHCIFGEPIPVLYNKLHQCVIFRIGQRLYLLLYEYHGHGRAEVIGRIRLTLEQILTGDMPEQILYNRNLVSRMHRYNDDVNLAFEDRTYLYSDMINFSAESGLTKANDNNPNEWSQRRWDYLKELWKGYSIRFSISDTQEDRDKSLQKWMQANEAIISFGLPD